MCNQFTLHRYSLRLWIPWAGIRKIRMSLTWPNHVLHRTSKRSWKDIRMRCIGSIYSLLNEKGLRFYQTRCNATVLYDTLPAYCLSKVVVVESEEIKYEKVYVSPRPPPTISFKDNWMKELDSEVAGSSKDTQRIQPKPKTQLSRTERPVGGNESTYEIEKDILFGHEDIKHSTRTVRPVDWSKSIQSCVSMPVKNEEEDQTRTVRPVGGQQSTKVEELDIDFRVPGLSHAVVKEAEHFRVQELVKKIESHPHREALQADLQQNDVYNPFSKKSKAMKRELRHVELFELCETIPKVQCSECLLHWNQGVIHCTSGQFLVESESRRKFNKLRLGALSIPHYVTKKGHTHGARVPYSRYSRSISQRSSLSCIATQNWLDRAKVHRDGQVGTGGSLLPSIQRGIQNISRTMVSHLEEVMQKSAHATSTRFSSWCLSQKPSPPRVRRTSCRTHFSTTILEMASFLKRFMVGQVWMELVELIRKF